jgi:phosphoglycerate kinase
MIFTFYKAMGAEVGKSIVEEDKIDLAKELMNKAKGKIMLPIDIVAADKFENDSNFKTVYETKCADMMGMDIGNETIKISRKKYPKLKQLYGTANGVLKWIICKRHIRDC